MLNKIKELIIVNLSENEDIYAIIFNSKSNRILDFVDYQAVDYIYLAILRYNYNFNNLTLNFYEFREEIEKLGFNTIVEGLDSFFKYHDDFISQVNAFRQSDDIIKDKLLNQLKEIIKNTNEFEKYPNLNVIIKNKDRDQIQTWLKNAYKMNYVNNFISYGLNHNELLLCDSRISL